MDGAVRTGVRRSIVVVAMLLTFGGWGPAVAAGPGVEAIAVGGTHSCALRTDHTIWCWGFGSEGRLGDGTTGDPVTHIGSTPVRVLSGAGPVRDATGIAAGGYHSCAIRSGGRVVCWGDNLYGQVGNGQAGAMAYRTTAVRVRKGDGFLTGVTRLAAGDSHTCALRFDATVLCWGDGAYGQLGDGTSGPGHMRTKAVRVRQGQGYLTRVVSLTAGYRHTCALMNDDSAWCWGDGVFGQLGDGGSGGDHRRTKATRVRRGIGPLTRVSGISVGSNHTCVRRVDGSAWCFGHDVQGQLGDGTTGALPAKIRVSPVRVLRAGGDLTRVSGVGAGNLHTCARRSDGSAWCWGWAEYGQVGDGTTGDPVDHRRLRAVRVVRASGSFTRVRRVDGGGQHTCALRADHTVWCWGDNRFGQLGRGTTDSDPHPYPLKVLFP